MTIDNHTYATRHPELNKKEPKKTAGEKIYNEFTYRGVDFALNALVGVSFTYWAGRTPQGQKIIGKRLKGAFEKGFSPILEGEALQKAAGAGRDFLSIMMGGTVIIPPIMYLENHKEELVEKLDRRIYGDEEVDNNERFSLSYERIRQEPHQSFWVGMGARMLSLAPIFWAATYHNDLSNQLLYKPVGNISRYIAKTAGIEGTALRSQKAVNETGKVLLDKEGKELSNWDELHRIIGMDVGWTFIYSYMHEYSYKFMADLFDKSKEDAQTSRSTGEEPPSKSISAQEAQPHDVVRPRDLPQQPEMRGM